MKNIINAECEKLMAIRSKAELYWVFFRLVQLICTLGLFYFLFFVMPIVASLQGLEGVSGMVSPFWVGSALLLNLGQILVAELALRAVAAKRIWGTVAGLVMAALLLPAWSFLVGAFGLYAFLNADFQRFYLSEAPEPFRNFLSLLNLSRATASAKE